MKKYKTWIAAAFGLVLGLASVETLADFEEKKLCCQAGPADTVSCVSRSTEEECPRGLTPMCTFAVE